MCIEFLFDKCFSLALGRDLVCRVPKNKTLGKQVSLLSVFSLPCLRGFFAECFSSGTRQTYFLPSVFCLPSFFYVAFGKAVVCQVPDTI